MASSPETAPNHLIITTIESDGSGTTPSPSDSSPPPPADSTPPATCGFSAARVTPASGCIPGSSPPSLPSSQYTPSAGRDLHQRHPKTLPHTPTTRFLNTWPNSTPSEFCGIYNRLASATIGRRSLPPGSSRNSCLFSARTRCGRCKTASRRGCFRDASVP
ncbi:hypothetical protein Salat_2480800 [Sesamum alatum]|uniref:Uncharacterized protein n=1 Tax=Sesamum alatum TaxID=300844 RepID=A0AAE2CBY7_9LAMI|nr:hypothetical protein Salat_2480800 [Sesamum alatum]